jgi:hypothetical protein
MLAGVLRLTAADPAAAITEKQAARIRYLLLEFIPATVCDVELGPGVRVTVPNHGVDELAPAIKSDIEAIIGCAIRAADLPD